MENLGISDKEQGPVDPSSGMRALGKLWDRNKELLIETLPQRMRPPPMPEGEPQVVSTLFSIAPCGPLDSADLGRDPDPGIKQTAL